MIIACVPEHARLQICFALGSEQAECYNEAETENNMIDTSFLNKNQREAVLADARYLRIIAGAGSGKTRVLTMRIAHLIQDLDIFPSGILAITFTNKAAREMKERVRRLLDEESANPWISTIHSLCVRILREDIGVIGWPKNFTIIDADDQKSIVREACKKYSLDQQEYPAGMLISYISNNKSAGIGAGQAETLAGSSVEESNKAKVYGYYLERQEALFALDFDDLILRTASLFDAHEEVLAKWQRRFRYILVDEFQDIDRTQYRLIRQLTGKDNDLLVVGDPDQTIYTWRGAEVGIIMNFAKDFPDCRTIVLSENYRSTDMILNGANSLIRNNRNRVDKDLFTARHSDQKITHYAALSDAYQAAWIAAQIRQLHRNGKPYADMAVLYRSNYLSRAIEKGLVDERIPYIIYGGVRFYERMEVKDALCYLRMVTAGDDLALSRILNKPKRGIGAKTIDTIAAAAERDGTSMYEAMKNHPDLCRGKTRETLGRFVSMVEKWRQEAALPDVRIDRLFERIIEESGYRAMLEEKKEEDRIENLKAVIDDVKEFMENEQDSSLDAYMQMVSLYGDREEAMASDCVQLMTVHAAKGLEFDTVFVTDMNDGIFPNERAMEDGSRGVEEERRLAYVAFTRARNKLYLTEAGGFSFILQKVKSTSRFIREIDESCIEHLGTVSAAETSRRFPDEDASFRTEQHVSGFSSPMRRKGVLYKKGDAVVHQKFGEGIVVSCDGTVVKIAFPYPYGIKQLAAAFPGLKKKSDLKN